MQEEASKTIEGAGATERQPRDHQKPTYLPWYLVGNGLNAIFCAWTFGGSVFLLFLHQLGMPKDQIGLLLSFFPFCGLLALWFAPIASRLGVRRVYLACFGARKLVMGGLLLVPWIIGHVGRDWATLFVIAVVFMFAILRSLAETAYYPWCQEFVPNSVRGRYLGMANFAATLGSCLALLLAGSYIGKGDDLSRFMLLIFAAVVVGITSALCFVFIPHGRPIPEAEDSRGHFANMGTALRDRNFRNYLAGFGCMTIGTIPIASFAPLYVKERLEVAAGNVILLEVASTVGVMLTALLWAWIADRIGSKRMLVRSAALGLLIPFGWLLMPVDFPLIIAGCCALYFIGGVAVGGMAMGAQQLLLNDVMTADNRTAYSGVYYAWAGLAGGLAPLATGKLLSMLAGWRALIGPMPLDAYKVLFLGSLFFLMVGLILFSRMRLKR